MERTASRLASVIGRTGAPGAGTMVAVPRAAESRLLGPALVRFTGRAEGDMADATGADAAVVARRRAVVDRPWTVLRQVHGGRVVTVSRPGQRLAEYAADAAVAAVPGVALAILTADCAPVAMASPEGIIGVAHAGWRGLLAGVLPETAAAMRALGASRIQAALGPCIHPGCYRFGADELDLLAARLGPSVRGTTADRGPALDLPAAVAASLAEAGVELDYDTGVCTACSGRHWSWRANRDRQRQAMVVWRP